MADVCETPACVACQRPPHRTSAWCAQCMPPDEAEAVVAADYVEQVFVACLAVMALAIARTRG